MSDFLPTEWKFAGAHESGFLISQHLLHNIKTHLVESIDRVIPEAVIECFSPSVSLVHAQLDAACAVPILPFKLAQDFSSNSLYLEIYCPAFLLSNTAPTTNPKAPPNHMPKAGYP